MIDQQKLAAESPLAVHRRSLESHARTRFHTALTLVQRKNEAKVLKRAKLAVTKRKIAEMQQANRLQLERQEKAFAERNPPHVVEWTKVNPTTAAMATPPVHAFSSEKKRLRVEGRGSIPVRRIQAEHRRS
jgi:oligoendopeptidase F